MNKKTYIYIFIGAVVLAVLIFFIFLKNNDTNTTPTVTATSSQTFSVSTLHKDVRVDSLGQTKTVVSQSPLAVGDTVRTLETGRALLQTTEDTTTANQTLLDYNSQATITRHDSDLTHDSIFLSRGSIWARVKKVFGQGEFYEIETQNAVAVVRGTSFGVKYINKQTTLTVATGTVAFMPLDQNTRERIIAKQVFVIGGKKAIIDDLGNVYVYDLTVADRADPWYIFNNPDEAHQTIPSAGTTTPTNIPINKPTDTISPTQPTPLTISSIFPATVISPGRVTLKGTGFFQLTNVVVGRSTLLQSDITVVSDTSLNFSTANIPAGTYDVSVIDIYQHTATLSNALTVKYQQYKTLGQ